jgi:hypothetical protein
VTCVGGDATRSENAKLTPFIKNLLLVTVMV